MRPHVTLSSRNSGKRIIVFIDSISMTKEYSDLGNTFTSISTIGGQSISVREDLDTVLAAIRAASPSA